MKSGYKTTEFWLSTLAVIAGLIMSSGVLDGLAETHWAVKVTALLISVLGALGYNAGRAKVKTAETDLENTKLLVTTVDKPKPDGTP